MPEKTNKQEIEIVQPERTHFQLMLAKNPNYFGNIPGSKLKPVFKQIGNITFEEITCVGYNPETQIMEATFSVKKSSGYSGNLCSAGSFEHIRFYLDFHDGAGFIDQGVTAINVHDIPAANDCKGKSIFPIQYVATLPKKTSKFSQCTRPLLPTMRAILSWNAEPPADSPDWPPVWGNVFNCDIQVKPWAMLSKLEDVNLGKYFKLATESPNLSAKELSKITGVKIDDLVPEPTTVPIQEIAKNYEKLNVPASRYAFKEVSKMVNFPTSEITMSQKAIMDELKIDYASIIDKIGTVVKADSPKANVDYEELECIGLDYNKEFLVASVKIKKKAGYSGNLCQAGSKEYVAFWIDWGDCSWTYLNTVELVVHDIDMPGNYLCYQVILPIDLTYHRKLCANPNILRIRGVLSWSVPPSTVNPDLLQFYGNRVDSHIQIKPGIPIPVGAVIPMYNIIGGIDVGHVNDLTGLTTPNSFFAYNGSSVPTGAPFGGIIVVNGPSFQGRKYRIKVTNLSNGSTYYVMDPLVNLVGYLLYSPWVQYTTINPDPLGWYDYLPPDKNTLNILARFTPGTEDKLMVELEIQGVAGSFSKTIQMDNTAPVIKLTVDDNGDCTHFHKGDPITGKYFVYDLFINNWSFWSTWGGNATGTANTIALPGALYSIPTNAGSYPCGAVSLYAKDKAILNSQYVGHEVWASYNLCLQ